MEVLPEYERSIAINQKIGGKGKKGEAKAYCFQAA